MSDQRREWIGWALSLAGFIITLAVLILGGGITIEGAQPEAPLRGPQPQFPIPHPEPREGGWDLSEPFLFQMASSDKMTGLEREEKLLLRYHQVLTRLDGRAVPQVAVTTEAGIATVTIAGEPFVTVLPQDCPEYFHRLDANGQLALMEEVAYAWARVLQDDLVDGNVKRLPEYLLLFNYLALLLFFLVCMAHLVLNRVGRHLKKPLWSVKLLIWLFYSTVVCALHPSLGSLAHVLTRGAVTPIFDFVFIGLGVALLHQLTHLGIKRYLATLAEFESEQDSVRAEQRRRTKEHAWAFVSKVTWSFLGLCMFLSEVGVDLTQFFAGAGLVGVVIGLMARDVFLDFFSGFYILAEDQFGMGDWIEANQDYGQVVAFSLRATQLRRTDGGLASIPNSDLRRVRNYSHHYSMVDYRVAVTYKSDAELGLSLLMDEASQLQTECPEILLAPAQLLGIQELGSDGVVLRLKLKTAPGTHLETQRRLNRRIKKRFDQEGIRFAGEHDFLEVRMLPEGEG